MRRQAIQVVHVCRDGALLRLAADKPAHLLHTHRRTADDDDQVLEFQGGQEMLVVGLRRRLERLAGDDLSIDAKFGRQRVPHAAEASQQSNGGFFAGREPAGLAGRGGHSARHAVPVGGDHRKLARERLAAATQRDLHLRPHPGLVAIGQADTHADDPGRIARLRPSGQRKQAKPQKCDDRRPVRDSHA